MSSEKEDTTTKLKTCKHCNGTGVVRLQRKVTEYNKFFTKMMQADAIKKLPHQQRMKAIARLWAIEKLRKKNEAAKQ